MKAITRFTKKQLANAPLYVRALIFSCSDIFLHLFALGTSAKRKTLKIKSYPSLLFPFSKS